MLERMNPTMNKVVIVLVCVIICAAAGFGFARALDKKEDFDRMIEARDAAPDKEEFDRNFDAMGEWFDEYKRMHPDASDEDAKRAYDDLWKG